MKIGMMIYVLEMNLFPEFLIGISVVYLVLYGLFSAFDLRNNFPLIQSSTINLSILVIFLACLLLFNDSPRFDVSLIGAHEMREKMELFFVLLSTGIKYKHNAVLYLDPYKLFLGKMYTTPTVCYDFFSCVFKIVIGISSIICLLMSKEFLAKLRINSFEYSIVMLFAIIGLFLLCSANDFITVYLAIELQSLALYILAAFKKSSSYSVESGLKYFILGAFSSGFLLFGLSLLYGLLGSLNFTEISVLVQKPGLSTDNTFGEPFAVVFPSFDNIIFVIILFIFMSLFFKLALAPFHAWAPDVYEGSPSTSTFFFSVVSKLGIFVLLFRFYLLVMYDTVYMWKYIIVSVGILSIIVGCFGGIEQRKLKSLLTYSSISHMGYIVLALCCVGYFAIQMAVSYILVYVVSGLSLWSIFMITRLKRKHYQKKMNKDLGDLVLLTKSNKLLALCFAIALFSMAGMPPMAGFLAKLNIFFVLFTQENMIGVALFSVLLSVISTFYYIRIVKILYFEPVLVGRLYYPITNNKPVIIVILTIAFIFFFINPNMLYLLAQKLSHIYTDIDPLLVDYDEFDSYIFSSDG